MTDDSKATKRATKRPDGVKAPEGWTNVPLPEPAEPDAERQKIKGRDPVRYGDWEKKGIAIDF